MRYGKIIMAAALLVLIIVFIRTQPNTGRTADEIGQDIVSSGAVRGMEEGGARELKRYFGIGSGSVKGYVVYIGSEELGEGALLVLKAENGASAQELRHILERRIGVSLPEGILSVKGPFLLYAAGGNEKIAESAFNKSVRE